MSSRLRSPLWHLWRELHTVTDAAYLSCEVGLATQQRDVWLGLNSGFILIVVLWGIMHAQSIYKVQREKELKKSSPLHKSPWML